MIDHRVVDIKTGKPVPSADSNTIDPRWFIRPEGIGRSNNIWIGVDLSGHQEKTPPLRKASMGTEQSYEQQHAQFCDSVRIMLGSALDALKSLTNLSATDEKMLRSIKWETDIDRSIGGEEKSVPHVVTVPVALLPIRRELEFLEQFFKREVKK